VFVSLCSSRSIHLYPFISLFTFLC
jgi:hypothetical protein